MQDHKHYRSMLQVSDILIHRELGGITQTIQPTQPILIKRCVLRGAATRSLPQEHSPLVQRGKPTKLVVDKALFAQAGEVPVQS